MYVKEEFRKNNIGRELMITSHKYAKRIKAKRIQLSTAVDNFVGQSLYESLGYVKDNDFYNINKSIITDDSIDHKSSSVSSRPISCSSLDKNSGIEGAGTNFAKLR